MTRPGSLLAAAMLALGVALLRCLSPAAVGLTLLLPQSAARAQDDKEVEQEHEAEGRGQERERESERESDLDIDRESDREQSRGDIGLDVEPDVVLAIDLSDHARVAVRRLGFRVVEEESLPGLGFRLTQLSTPGGIPPQRAVERLRRLDPAGTYDVNPRYFEAGEPACAGIRCSAQKMIGWPQEGCLTPVRIGLVDTAVAGSSPALAGARLEQRHFGNAAGAPPEAAEHGTEVATILAGSSAAGFAGLLPKATLLAADVFDFSRERGASTDAALLARGMDWLLERHPDAVNVSIAGPDNLILHQTVRRVVQQGVPVIAAVGNLGPEGPPRYPAAYAEVIAVTAVDQNGQIYARANQGEYIDVAAPGVHIWSAGADGQGRFVEGTSFAAPFATAEVALLHAGTPQSPAAGWKEQLRGSALAVGATPQPRVFGAGLLHSHGCTDTLPQRPEASMQTGTASANAAAAHDAKN